MESEPESTPAFDEHRDPGGSPRAGYAQLLEALSGLDLSRLSETVTQRLQSKGVTFGTRPFLVDPVPRLISAPEWHLLEAGLAQRTQALNLFLLDAYGAQRVVREGIVSIGTMEQAEGFEADLSGRLPQRGWPAAIIGFDLVRDPHGEFLVLEDNVRTPSGFAYALAAREALLHELPPGCPMPRPIDPVTFELLRGVISAAAPSGARDPALVVLTDGPKNVAYYEHEQAAVALGATLATPEELVTEGEQLRLRVASGGTQGVDVVYRRTDEDRVRDEHGNLTDVARKLLPPWLGGTIGLVNAYGNGLADDKLVHGHVEEFIRFYLGEEPLLRSVPTTEVRADPQATIRHLDELVVKPRHGHGGVGVVIGPHADRDDLDVLARELERNPESYISQPTVPLSRHPTVIEGRLEPRHVDLRPFAFATDEVRLMPGGLSRVALAADALVVNSSQDGGGKDTWVLE